MKNENIYSSLLTGNDEDAPLLDAWLDERIMRKEASKADLPDEIINASQNNGALANAVGEYDADIAPGQIRILSKRFTLEPDVIPYVAVIEQWEDGIWLVAPFSEYSYPATPGEMATCMRHLGLRVLQAWNARTVPSQLLKKSFLFGNLKEKVRQNVADLFRHEFAGKKLPDTFDALTGPEIVYDVDPRRDYLVENVARLRPLSTAVKAMARMLAESEEVRIRNFPIPVWGKPEYKLAAGNATDVTETFVIEKDELSVEYSHDDRKARITVYDQDDKPNCAYDGYGILAKSGEFLGALQNGAVTISGEALKDGFELVDTEGQTVTFRVKGE